MKTENKKINLSKKSWKILAILFAVILFAQTFALIFNNCVEKKYTSTATVVDIIPNENNTTVCFQLVNNKHIFCIETDQSYEIGEIYNLTFSNSKTDTILDDKIIEIKRPV